jgi:hypothetical protein
MISLISALTSLATEGLKLANTKISRKYIDEMLQLQKELLAEESKGFNSDDQKIVEIRKKLKLVVEAANRELQLLSNK